MMTNPAAIHWGPQASIESRLNHSMFSNESLICLKTHERQLDVSVRELQARPARGTYLEIRFKDGAEPKFFSVPDQYFIRNHSLR